MSTVSGIEAFDCGDDVLRVTGQVDGQDVEASGWVSATTNHYAATDYDSDGNLKDGAEPQQMSVAQIRAYCRQLLLDAAAAAPEIAAAEPRRVL